MDIKEVERLLGKKTKRRSTKVEFPFFVVRTAFHGGGVVSRHRYLHTAEVAAAKYKVPNCDCGCAGVVPSEEFSSLQYAEDCYNPYTLAK